MNVTNNGDRRRRSIRRKKERLVRFLFFDSRGEPLLWDRRKRGGRRKTDLFWHWSRKDIPGLALIGFLFIMLTVALLYLWTNDILRSG